MVLHSVPHDEPRLAEGKDVETVSMVFVEPVELLCVEGKFISLTPMPFALNHSGESGSGSEPIYVPP